MSNVNNPLGAGGIKLIAPAKVNLLLNIKGKQPNGYHSVDTIMHTLALHDVLYMKLSNTAELAEEFGEGWHADVGNCAQIALTMRMHEGLPNINIKPESNIAYKAIASLLDASTNVLPQNTFIRVHIEKHIPAQAGLAGGSTDAAAGLVGAAKLLGLNQHSELLENVASEIGADVAFFLRGGCAAYKGVGNVFARALEPARTSMLLVKPKGGLSTASAYAAFDKNPQTIPSKVLEVVGNAKSACEVPLYNNMTCASEELLPDIAKVRNWLEKLFGKHNVLMCGSGACVFALCENFNAATNGAQAAKAKGWWARSTTLANLRATAF